MLEETVRDINDMLSEMLSVVDGPLDDATRFSMGPQRIVTYLRAAELQQERVAEWLYEPAFRISVTRRFPLDQGQVLCDAHFLFICWDSVYKVLENLLRNAYGVVTPPEVLKIHRGTLEHYRTARNHLEHLAERFSGEARTDWRGNADSISGSVAGVDRTGHFVFQGSRWDITEHPSAILRTK